MTYPGSDKTVAEVRDELIAQIGEKITVRRWAKVELAGARGRGAFVRAPGRQDRRALESRPSRAAVAAHPEVKKFIDDARCRSRR